MSKPFLTIGIATYEDYHGLYFTVQALKMYHDVSRVQLVVVDNNPKSQHGQHCERLINAWSYKFHDAKYIKFEQSNGTTQTRQALFDYADGEAVVSMDSHVILQPNAVRTLIRYWEDNPDSRDIISGPLLHDDLMHLSTHFHPRWRGEMFGIWAHGFFCKNPACHHGFVMDILPHEEGTVAEQLMVAPADMLSGEPVTHCPSCNHSLPEVLPFIQHQQAIMEQGYEYMFSPDKPETHRVVEIPSQGLGFFSMLKKHWPGFNPHCRGFGGEEGYIHEKVRQRGGRALLVPGLGWNHRFGRPDGVKYPLRRYDKVRNYVLNWKEIGYSLDGIKEHFIDTGLLPERTWNDLVMDPTKHNEPRSGQTKAGLEYPKEDLDLRDLLDWVRSKPRDLNQHVHTLAKFSAECNHVTEVTNRRESTVGLACGQPKELISYTTEADELITKCLLPKCVNTKAVFSTSKPNGSIDPTDLLFLDDQHNGPYIRDTLAKYAPSVNKYIILHDTELHGRKGDRQLEGMWPALREFVNHTEWNVVYHAREQYGLTVLSCDPKIPTVPEPWPPGWGPGTELKKMLSRIGITATPNCKCNERAETMDREGIEWCELNMHQILDWLQEESVRRNMPFSKTAASVVVKLAIRKAKKVRKAMDVQLA